MAERHTVLEPEQTSKPTEDAAQALREANLRAEKAERELARLKAGDTSSASGTGSHKDTEQPRKAHASEGDEDPEATLRNDPMMAHLLDSLAAGKDIGHYGRLVFAMVARHFMPHEQVLARLTQDPDFSEEQANLMLRQVEGRDYNPPKRERILAWQAEQDFPIIPNPEDPDSGNLYRNLKFPDSIYHHIEHYQEQKIAAE